MQDLQPKIAELQKKYAKDKQKLAEEQMRLYKESGMSPAGCLIPMLIQLPIWIALYQSIIRLLAITPEDFLGLSKYLYPWPIVYSTLPVGSKFLWLNLAVPDQTFLLAVLVGGAMWVQQKMVMTSTADPKQQSQNQMMLWMMPIIFAMITLSVPSGLALFWMTSSIIRVVIQYFISGWGGLVSARATRQVSRDKRYKERIAQVEEAPLEGEVINADIVEPSPVQKEGSSYGESGDKRQDRRGSYPTRLRTTRAPSRRSKGHRHKRR
jgi:YidC/Oxa1 family membrane protein insertase